MNFGRRRILQGLAGLAGGLPFLRSAPLRAADEHPRRLVIFFTPNEFGDRSLWQPGPAGPLLALPKILAPLDPYRERLTMIGGLDMQTRAKETKKGGHLGIAHMLTGRVVSSYGDYEHDYWASGISVDQSVAARLEAPAMTLGARASTFVSGYTRMSYLGKDQPVHPLTDPQAVFDKYFGAALPDPQAAQRRARKKSVLDAATRDLQALMPRLGADDGAKLQAHLDRVREIEKGLEEDAKACPATPASPPPLEYEANENMPSTVRRQIELMAAALACDLTRVASLQVGDSGGPCTPTWPDEGLAITQSEHELIHAWIDAPDDPTIRKQRIALEKFYSQMFAYLLQQLDAIPEGEGTLLDHSLVLYAKNLGYRHQSKDMLFLLAGSAGGALQTGRFVDLPGRPHNDLLVSLCQLMGLDDVETFGDPECCTGPLPL